MKVAIKADNDSALRDDCAVIAPYHDPAFRGVGTLLSLDLDGSDAKIVR
jgi:hypothetical protein